jgi:hypothetical protein
MSTKTLRKRIALVAVAALGAGVLSVAPANAVAITSADIFISPANAGSLAAAGVCSIDSKALAADITNAISTTTVIQVGAALTFDSTTNGTGSLVISGPATWTTISTSTVSLDAKTVNFVMIAMGGSKPVLTASAVGSITVTAYDAVSGGGVARESYLITVVESCTSAAAVSAANSLLDLEVAAG